MTTTNDRPTADPHAQLAIERRGLDGASMERKTTAAVVLAEKASAMVQARIMQAIARPRDFYVVRERILKACARPRFAETARYEKPIGRAENKSTGQWEEAFAIGLSIGFATEAARLLGNIDVTPTVVFEDARTRTMAVVATDLETNYSTSEEFTLEKFVERKKLKTGQTAVSQRVNSSGDVVYLIEANEDEFNVKARAALSKAWRNVVLKLVPADLKEEAMDEIEHTLQLIDDAEKAGKPLVDPTARRKKLIDWFRTQIGVSAAELTAYLERPIENANSQDMRRLQSIADAIGNGDLSWALVMEAKNAKVESADANGVVSTPENARAAAVNAKVAEAIEATKKKNKGAAKTKEPAAGGEPAKTDDKPAPAAAAPAAPAAAAKPDAPAAEPAKPATTPSSAGLEEASQLSDSLESASTEEEIDTVEQALAGAIEGGRIGSTHVSRVRSNIEKARKRVAG